MEEVILVDENDAPIGSMEKMEAHRVGKRHRAFSIFIFNSKGEFLLQRRALNKYHSGGLWSNTCCGHPRPGEETHVAALRRLEEESGLKTELTFLFNFSYRADFENGLVENEIDYLYTGITDVVPVLHPHEVEAWKYITESELLDEVKEDPELFTAWFKICLKRLIQARS